MELVENSMISEKIYQAAAILIPTIGLIFLISGIVLLILKKKKESFKNSRPVRRMSIYLIAAGIVFLLIGLLIVICLSPYLRAGGL